MKTHLWNKDWPNHSACMHKLSAEHMTHDIDKATCKQCLVRVGIVRDCPKCEMFKYNWNYCASCGKKHNEPTTKK